MRKFPKIKYPGDPDTDGILNDEVVVTEKLDGANFRFTWNDDGKLVIGTRNRQYHDEEHAAIPSTFDHAIEYLTETIPDGVSTNAVLQQYTYYGEAMHLHSLDYDDIDWETPSSGSPHVPLESDIPNVVLFDARDDEGWLDWDHVSDVADELGLELVPTLERGDPDDLDCDIPDESVFGGPPEGIVVRRVDGTVRAKKVTDDFNEKNAVAFEDPSKAESDAAEFVAAYVTRNRIEKMAHILVDEGVTNAPKMELMEVLPKRVLQDVMWENGWELLTSGGFEATWDDEFKSEVRSRTSTKCARTLKRMINSF